MRTALLLIALLFSSMVFTGCTNDEGENDLDFIMPDKEEESALNLTSKKED